MAEDKVRQTPIVQSLDRDLMILQAVALSKQPVSLGEVKDLLRINHSSACRLANTLRRRGFLACPAGRKEYILGSSIWRLSQRYDWGNMLIRAADKQLQLLADQVDETAHLAIREGKSALFIDHAAASSVIAVASQVGKLVPLYCTAHGKALLADADELAKPLCGCDCGYRKCFLWVAVLAPTRETGTVCWLVAILQRSQVTSPFVGVAAQYSDVIRKAGVPSRTPSHSAGAPECRFCSAPTM